jgi:hypothetical protein
MGKDASIGNYEKARNFILRILRPAAEILKSVEENCAAASHYASQ